MVSATETQRPEVTCWLEVTVNGQAHRSQVEPRLLLAHYLRENLSLTGTHIACDTSQCGACTVLLDGEAVKSCTVLAVQAQGASITTIEGLAPIANPFAGASERTGQAGGNGQPAGAGQAGTLHPLQIGFWEEHGLQCGF